MTQETDDQWHDLLMGFSHDVASYLAPIQGYVDMLEHYLKGLQQEPVSSEDDTPTHEQALHTIQLIQQQARALRERRHVISQELGFAVGRYETTPDYEGKWRDLLIGLARDVSTYIAPLHGYADTQVLYFKNLGQQTSVPSVSLGSTTISPELTLRLTHIIQEHIKRLHERKNKLYEESNLNTGSLKGSESS